MASADKKVAKKRGRGRPTSYRPEYCERIIELGDQGMGICEIATTFDVCPQTIYDWKAKHQEFGEAFARARNRCQSWWERNGRINLDSREFNYGLWKLNMVNRFPKDWADKSKTEHSGEIKTSVMDLLKEAQE